MSMSVSRRFLYHRCVSKQERSSLKNLIPLWSTFFVWYPYSIVVLVSYLIVDSCGRTFFRLYTKVIFLDGNIAITIHVVCTRYLVFPYIFLQEPWLAKNTKNMPFFVCFRPFLVQTDNHIIKALGINYSYWSKDQSCSISQRILRIDGFDKHSFFWVSHFGPFWNFFLLETMKSRQW